MKNTLSDRKKYFLGEGGELVPFGPGSALKLAKGIAGKDFLTGEKITGFRRFLKVTTGITGTLFYTLTYSLPFTPSDSRETLLRIIGFCLTTGTPLSIFEKGVSARAILKNKESQDTSKKKT